MSVLRAFADVRLPVDLARYRDERPTQEQRQRRGIDGSGMELEIVSCLVRYGFSDEEIIDYFDRHALPRYMEEGGSTSWLESLVTTARANREKFRAWRSSDGLAGESDDTHNTRVIEKQHTPARKRAYDPAALPFFVLEARVSGEAAGHQPILTAWYQEIIEVSRQLVTEPVGLATARKLAGRLRKREYVQTEKLPGNRERVLLTDKGRSAAVPVRGRWSRYIYLGGRSRAHPPFPESHSSRTDDRAKLPSTEVRQTTRRPSSPERRRHLKIVSERKHERMNGGYRLSFRGNKVRYIHVLTPFDDWLGADVWENLVTGIDAEGLPVFSWIAADDNDDPLRPLVPPQWQPYECVFALAVELEKREGEFVIGEYVSANGTLRQRIGIIEQSRFNFFKPLTKIDWEGKILSVRGTGSGMTRMYDFQAVADVFAVETSLTLESVLFSLEPDHHLETLAALPRGWFFMPLKRKELVSDLLDLRTDPAGRSSRMFDEVASQ